MKQMLEERWRQPMWTGMMSRLPATITINMKTQSYAVRDNSLQFIYTDDIDEAGVDDMMQELAEQLNFASRREFREAFSMKRLKQAWNEDRKGYTLFSQMGGAGAITLRTDAIFGQGVRDMVMEFRFDLFDINTLLPERIYRAEEYGE